MSHDPLSLFAGMPSISISDVARMRLEVISFFLLVFVLSAVAVRWLWNGFAKDHPRLPRLGYGRALNVTVLWGLLFVLVLTMISGARELMTPGAWKKDGLTYKLADAPDPAAAAAPPAGPTAEDRRRKIEGLRVLLWGYAAAHGGAFPTSTTDPGVPADAWQTPHPSGMSYVYVPGLSLGGRGLLACEPDLFGDDRFALFADGSIRRASSGELADLLNPKGSK
jgi:hypothetical protein